MDALDIAQKGRYSGKAFKEFRLPYLINRYFVSEGSEYLVSDNIRAMCSFRNEDVIVADPPRPLDLVSCRNLLIYMKGELQGKMISKFYDAIRPEGLLFLGMSENIGLSGAATFTPIDPSLRIFSRKSRAAAHDGKAGSI